MINKRITVNNSFGLETESAGEFCALAMGYSSNIRFKYRGENEANAKSVLSILGAGIRNRETIELICDGADEIEALQAIEEYLLGNR